MTTEVMATNPRPPSAPAISFLSYGFAAGHRVSRPSDAQAEASDFSQGWPYWVSRASLKACIPPLTRISSNLRPSGGSGGMRHRPGQRVMQAPDRSPGPAPGRLEDGLNRGLVQHDR